MVYLSIYLYLSVYIYNIYVRELQVHDMLLQLCPTLRPYGLQPTSLLCPWDFPSKNTRVGRHSLLQGIFPIQSWNWCLQVSCIDRQSLHHQDQLGSPHGVMSVTLKKEKRKQNEREGMQQKTLQCNCNVSTNKPQLFEHANKYFKLWYQ